jgi:hypothetical protein
MRTTTCTLIFISTCFPGTQDERSWTYIVKPSDLAIASPHEWQHNACWVGYQSWMRCMVRHDTHDWMLRPHSKRWWFICSQLSLSKNKTITTNNKRMAVKNYFAELFEGKEAESVVLISNTASISNQPLSIHLLPQEVPKKERPSFGRFQNWLQSSLASREQCVHEWGSQSGRVLL